MNPSWRKPAGIAMILLLILGWSVVVTTLAGPIDRLPGWAKPPFYLIGGLAWIVPLKPLLRWMETGRWR